MPRTSAASLSVATKSVVAELMRARAGLPAPIAAAFDEILASVGPQHFKPADRILLEELARSLALLREAGAHVARDGIYVDGKVHPCLRITQKERALVAMLATRLRLTPQSRSAPGKAAFTRMRVRRTAVSGCGSGDRCLV